jgi:DNA-binding transcriptional MerR regulator
MKNKPELNLDQLASLTGLPPRTVRYYIQIGLVDRPEGVGKGAYYTERHAEQLIAIRKWSEAGLSLERIRQILEGAQAPIAAPPRKPGTVEVCSHLVVTDGVEIQLEPGRAGMTPEQVRTFFREVMAAYGRVIQREDE